MQKLLFVLACVLAVPAVAQVSITASSVTDSFENPVPLARLCFTPVDATGTPSGFRVGTRQVIPMETCGKVTLGVLAYGLHVAPNPTGMYYRIVARASQSNTVLRDYGMTPITGSTWTLDTYDPNLAVLPVSTLSAGTTTMLAPGSAPTLSVTPGSPALLNVGIPAGTTGATGATGPNMTGCTGTGGNLSCNTIAAPQVGPFFVADMQAVTGCAQKINAAITASGGIGTIQVGAGCGYTITTTVNPTAQPVAIQFVSKGAWTQSAPIIVGNAGSLSGPHISGGSPPAVLVAANNYAGQCPADTAGVSYYAQVCMGQGSTIHDLGLDGNKVNQTYAVQGLLLQNANAVNIYQMLISNASQDNIHTTSTFYPTVTASQALSLNTIVFLYSSTGLAQLYKVTTAGTGTSSYPGYPSSSCTPTLGSTCTWGGVTFTNIGPTYDNASSNGLLGPHVLSNLAGRDGLFTERTQDWLVAPQVEFENNTRDGFHCEDCAAWRFSDDDWGANGRYAYYAAVVNGFCASGDTTSNHFILGSQLSGNTSGDIVVDGSAASAMGFCATPSPYQLAGGFEIVGNQLGGPDSSASLTNAIQFTDAGSNNVVGNTWNRGAFTPLYNYLVTSAFSTITSGARAGNQISKSTISPNYAGNLYQAATPYSLTAGVDVADAVVSQGTETQWGNRIINGSLVVAGGSGGIAIDASSAGLSKFQYLQVRGGAAIVGNTGNGDYLQHNDGTGANQPAAFDANGNTTAGTTIPTKSGTPTVGAGVCWKTASILGTCTAGTWPSCSTCN